VRGGLLVRFLAALLLAWGTLAAPFAPGARADEPVPQALRVYHIGNSVTDTLRYPALREAAKAKGKSYVFGRHMIPGAPLAWIHAHPDSGFKEEPYGYYPKALSGYEWDVLTLQPFDRHLSGDDGDRAMAKKFIDLALGKSQNLRVYVYSRWPRRAKDGSLDFAKRWGAAYTGKWDGTNETRDYFERVVAALRQDYPKTSIHLVPVGDVLLELDRRMQAGKVPGYDSITKLYTDGIHFNDAGAYVVGCTFYATLFRDDPKGFPGAPYQVTDPAFAAAVQDAVWQVVRTHPLAGIARP